MCVKMRVSKTIAGVSARRSYLMHSTARRTAHDPSRPGFLLCIVFCGHARTLRYVCARGRVGGVCVCARALAQANTSIQFHSLGGTPSWSFQLTHSRISSAGAICECSRVCCRLYLLHYIPLSFFKPALPVRHCRGYGMVWHGMAWYGKGL